MLDKFWTENLQSALDLLETYIAMISLKHDVKTVEPRCCCMDNLQSSAEMLKHMLKWLAF